jgi:hypothetical protein
LLDNRYNGSKPIIASTGARTITRLVEVEEVVTDLKLDGNIDDINLPELRLVLAGLYQVPPTAITLRPVGGSVVIRVLIAGGSSTNLDEIAATVSAVDGSTLSAIVSTEVGTEVLHSTAPETSWRNVSRFEEHRCSPGHWCTAALIIEW